MSNDCGARKNGKFYLIVFFGEFCLFCDTHPGYAGTKLRKNDSHETEINNYKIT